LFTEQQRNVQQSTNQPTQEQQARQQLQDLITPFVKPGMDAVQLVSADTRDYVDFYSEDRVKDDKDAVEKMFNELKGAGRPIPRRDIYDYLQGKLHRENPEEFETKVKARKQKQLEAVSGSIDFGASAADRAKNDPIWSNVRNMSVDDLGKALEGVTF